ncbi:GL12267 [Drosophila persimilis]|uniref:GL12267 n=1 Tax=Drosophila persimilis TaxID=7234 RepID=B4GMD9_DROPE|nr:GL12267 [Drosophila persimilis]
MAKSGTEATIPWLPLARCAAASSKPPIHQGATHCNLSEEHEQAQEEQQAQEEPQEQQQEKEQEMLPGIWHANDQAKARGVANFPEIYGRHEAH